jgi:hypothetical protein
MNDTNLISAETVLKAPPAPGDVRAGLAGYAEWSGSPPVLTDAVELIDQLAQLIADLEAERDKLRARLAEIEAQKPVLEVKKRGCEVGVTYGGCVMAGYGAFPVGSKLYASPVTAQAVQAGWRPATEDPTDGGLYWVLIGDQPHVARFSNRTSTARWWSAYGIPRAVAEEPTHWMPIPDAPEAAR